MTIAGIFAIIKLGSVLREGKAFQPFVFGTGALVTFSAFQCLCLSFDTFDGMNTGDMGGFFLLMKSIFQSFHFGDLILFISLACIRARSNSVFS